MSKYIDGYVLPISTDSIEAYKAMALQAAAIWKEHGALDYVEAVGDDLDGKNHVSFSQLAGTQPGETVIFAFIVYASREERDIVNAKVMADPRLQAMCPGHDPEKKMPFDPRRMAFGGFKALVEG